MEKVSIIIPVYANNKNIYKMTIDCLRDVIKTYGVEVEIIVVDDCSKEPIRKALPKMFPDIKLFTNEKNSGFAKTVNRGIKASTHDLICLLNNDTKLPDPSWLLKMVENMKENGLDLTAPAGGRMDKQWNYQAGEAKKVGEKFNFLPFWCTVIRKEVFDEIGLVPELFGKGYFDDVLFCYRAEKAGFVMGITENTKVQHLYHATFKAEKYNLAEEYNKKRKIFLDIIRKEK